jgi:hypothetical protein
MGESGGHGSLPWATVRPVLLELVARLSVKWMPSPSIACAEPRFIPRAILHDEDQRLSSGPAWIRTRDQRIMSPSRQVEASRRKKQKARKSGLLL